MPAILGWGTPLRLPQGLPSGPGASAALTPSWGASPQSPVFPECFLTLWSPQPHSPQSFQLQLRVPRGPCPDGVCGEPALGPLDPQGVSLPCGAPTPILLVPSNSRWGHPRARCPAGMAAPAQLSPPDCGGEPVQGCFPRDDGTGSPSLRRAAQVSMWAPNHPAAQNSALCPLPPVC